MGVNPEDQTEPQSVSALLHKLKSPLTIFKGYGEMALTRWDTMDDAKKRELVVKMMAAADSLERAIEYDMAAITGARNLSADATPEPIERFTVVLSKIVADLTPSFPNLTFSCDGCDAIPVLDPRVFAVLVHHLVENAYTYGHPDRTILVELFCGRPGFVGVGVTNAGDDSSPQVGSEVFERGVTSGRGNGLGLWIVKNYLLEMGGEVSVQQLSDGLDRFTFFFNGSATTERGSQNEEAASAYRGRQCRDSAACPVDS